MTRSTKRAQRSAGGEAMSDPHEFVFEDKDRLVPLRVLAAGGLRYVLLPTALFALAGGGWTEDTIFSYAWPLLLGWSVYTLVEGLERIYEIATADWILKTTVRQEQLTEHVLLVRVTASGFRPIKRISVLLLVGGRVVQRRALPASGRRALPTSGRWFSMATLLRLPATWGDGGAGSRRCHLRLIVEVEGCPEFVHDLPALDDASPEDQRFGSPP